ncbi:MAG TPA: outer membrane beta-barrel protein, partial [Alphaproteobacteria bacterium]|nr:outer membrane beta-barrel protein [Alphaproteobacteria bacterium]
DNALRDRLDNEITGRIAYELSPDYDVYLQGGYVNRDYNSRSNRDSDGYSVYGGVRGDITGKLFGDIYAGFLHHEYDNAAFGEYDGMGFGVNGYWNVTNLTTLNVNVGRDIQETIVAGAGGFEQTRFNMRLEHELRRNIILTAMGGYSYDDYEDIVREDDVWQAGLGARYLLNSHLHFFANYNYLNRDSNAVGNDYDQNRFLVGVRAAL